MSGNLRQLSISSSILVFLVLVPLITRRDDVLTWLCLTLQYIILSHSWNIIGGYAGQRSLGHAAFFGLGALIARYLWLSGLPLFLGLLAGASTAAIFAIIIGFPTFRMRGIYFAIGTLVLAEILRIIFETTLPQASVFPKRLLATYNLVPRYYLSLLIAGFTVGTVYWISHSTLGLGMISIREEQDAAEASGVDTLRHKLLAFAISSFFAGLAGGVFTYYAAALRPGQMFEPVWTFDAVVIVFVGGVGTISGPIIGAVFFVLLKQLLSIYLPGGIHILVFGVLFIIVVLFLPGGLIKLMPKLRKRISRGRHPY